MAALEPLHTPLDSAVDCSSGIPRLSLTNFRSYPELTLPCELTPIAFTGPNGAGKTNLLEAISLLTPGRGLRAGKLSEH